MPTQKFDIDRSTTTDLVFDTLYEEISTLTTLPGTKMSEVEVAQRFGVSRQPVRDAFNRLWNLDLLVIRPQKATVVRGFSMDKISQARFLRLAVELEVINRACEVWDSSASKKLNENLKKQQLAVNGEQWEKFHRLDHDFHVLICQLSDSYHAIDTIRYH